ncbi:large ribosomal subunit protein uL2z-like [Miscanthus floridulus]|uniref:large ribosomal subunit protein uL2z-like n=1 Tax=Miscanthus floridulus TaxID=154761 RepID=UPI00345B3D43
MDGGSGLNIMYAKTLDEMGVDRTRLHPTRAPFHGIMPGKQAMPLDQIDLPITFRDQFNYRTETLTFEVVGLPETFHAILFYSKYYYGRRTTLSIGNVLSLRGIPKGAVICNIEHHVGDRGVFARASWDYAIVISHNPDNDT